MSLTSRLRVGGACAPSSCAAMRVLYLASQETKWKTSRFPKIVYAEQDNCIFIGLYRTLYLDVFPCLSLLVAFVGCRQEFSKESVVPVICSNAGL